MRKFNKYTLWVLLMNIIALPAFAQDGQGGGNPMAAAIAIAVAALGGTIAQGITASSALSGIARNPGAGDKVFIPMILGLALIESLVIFAFVIAFLVK